MDLKYLAAVVVIGLSGANVASATLMLNEGNADCAEKLDSPSQGSVEAAFKLACETGSVTQLYKSNFDEGTVLGLDEKPFAGSYETTFGGFKKNGDEAPTTALIEYVFGPVISGYESVFVLAKGGNQTPNFYGWDITGWNGTDSIFLTGWSDVKGSISNITIWAGKQTSVPEPATLGLLGVGLAGLGLMRRKKKAVQ